MGLLFRKKASQESQSRTSCYCWLHFRASFLAEVKDTNTLTPDLSFISDLMSDLSAKSGFVLLNWSADLIAEGHRAEIRTKRSTKLPNAASKLVSIEVKENFYWNSFELNRLRQNLILLVNDSCIIRYRIVIISVTRYNITIIRAFRLQSSEIQCDSMKLD